MFNRRSEFTELSNLIQNSISNAISPLTTKIQILDEKVDKLSQDRVVRSDLEKMQNEVKASMVPRDTYEYRHASLVERDAQIEATVHNMRRDLEERVKSFETRFDKGSAAFSDYLQKIDDKLDLYRTQSTEQVEKKMKEQSEVHLSQKDRAWVRGTQITSVVIGVSGVILALVSLLVTILTLLHPTLH